MEKESTINHMRREVKGRNAIGLVQWTPPTKLYDWVYEKTLKKENNDIDMQLERIIYESTQGDLQWSINEHPAHISFAEFVHSTEEVGKLAEVFYMCYEQYSEELQPERGKWAEKWKEILEILNH